MNLNRAFLEVQAGAGSTAAQEPLVQTAEGLRLDSGAFMAG
jgi:hypothetical protein